MKLVWFGNKNIDWRWNEIVQVYSSAARQFVVDSLNDFLDEFDLFKLDCNMAVSSVKPIYINLNWASFSQEFFFLYRCILFHQHQMTK